MSLKLNLVEIKTISGIYRKSCYIFNNVFYFQIILFIIVSYYYRILLHKYYINYFIILIFRGKDLFFK